MTDQHPIDEIELPPFEGFPPDGLAFLRSLKRNNNREWFRARRDRYEETVRFPMQCLIASLARRMADAAPEIEFHPRSSIFRIYRDTRFSRNKTPYKTNVAASFPVRGRKGPAEVPGLYVGVEPGDVYAGGGLYLPSGAQLKLIRASIAGDPDRWLAVAASPRFLKTYGGIDGERLVRAPLGYPPTHPMIEHLKFKQFFAGRALPEEACLRGSFVTQVEKVFLDILPLIRWLIRAGA